MNVNMPTSSKSSKAGHHKYKSYMRHIISTLAFVTAAFLIGRAFFVTDYLVVTDYKERLFGWTCASASIMEVTSSNTCETQHKPLGTEHLPKGIVTATSDLELRPLWGLHKKDPKKSKNLLAMAVGMKQKESVDKIVKKFPATDFVVMLFHYDGIVNEWKDLKWTDRAIHVSATKQTKWWFAKRFLHPDIVSEYDYIFLWDEDLGVEHFNAGRYLYIIKEEGLEISQPALEPNYSEVHHELTKRQPTSRVHRWTDAKIGWRKCDENISGPPCAGFVEMMAPVFSRASWRCAWHMIQNDLVHCWGLDFQLGYCAQGDRSKNIGIVDSEYIIHQGLPTLGGSATIKPISSSNEDLDPRSEVKKWSFSELEIFKNRWRKATNDDNCWKDPFQQSS